MNPFDTSGANAFDSPPPIDPSPGGADSAFQGRPPESAFAIPAEIPPTKTLAPPAFAAKKRSPFLAFLGYIVLAGAGIVGGCLIVEYLLRSPEIVAYPDMPINQPKWESPSSPSVDETPSQAEEPPPAVPETVTEVAPAAAMPEPAEVAAKDSPLPAPAPEDTLETLRRQLDEAENPGAEAFIATAKAHEAASESAKALEILDEGLQAHPADDFLLLARADAMAESGNPTEAWRSLARTGKIDDPRYASRILRFGMAAGLYDETLVVLSTAPPESFAWTPAEWARVVDLYERTGQVSLALETAKRRLENPAVVARLTSLELRSTGRYPEALSQYQEYMDLIENPSPGDWREMSDLFRLNGREQEARESLEKAGNFTE